MLEFFYNKPERNRSFMKSGGVKRLRSLPKFLIEKQEIIQKINMIITDLSNIV
jgi:hypothetical protein